ncbi:Flp pilus assembly complex ATPase component TadA [bacterium]|nr:Flp pilus assembly complex ATPase component TadA [bacterium]
MTRRKRLGEILIDSRLITQEQLDQALNRSMRTRRRVGEVLVEMGFITDAAINSALGGQLGIPFVSLEYYSVDPEVITLIPEQFARRNKILPLFRVHDSLTLGMADPLNLAVIDQVVRTTGLEIEPAICSEKDLIKAIDHYYGTSGTMDEMIQVLDDETLDEDDVPDATVLTQMAGDAPIVKLVNLMISQAVRDHASDIHVEPDESVLRVRFRIDGILKEVYTQPRKLQNAIISRIKIMANINIAERRIPQDGGIQIKIDNRPVDIRVSTLPTVHGENVVLRILDKLNLMMGLNELGFGEQEPILRKILSRKNGIFLVTGPTSSGKTTTLYSALNELSKMDVNTITLEYPVEYKLPLIRQVQVNVKAGLTFASGLRSILRQDPNIIMVGEIRDAETAKIAVESALTGHLVISTLHTNDAAGALPRLVDMGVEPFLVASSVAGVIAQRLVRSICPNCKEEYNANDAELKVLGMEGQKVKLSKGKGCRSCIETGYKGRRGVFEVLYVTDDIRALVTEKASADRIRTIAVKNGTLLLRQDGISKALKGITTLSEVLRVTGATD